MYLSYPALDTVILLFLPALLSLDEIGEEVPHALHPVDLQLHPLAPPRLEPVPAEGGAGQVGRGLQLAESLARTGLQGARGDGHVAH